MQRREFLAASAAMIGAALNSTSQGQETKSERQWIEIRTYHFASAEKKQMYERFLAEAGTAAFGKAGAGPVGIFQMVAADNPKLESKETLDLWVVLPHDSAEALAGFEPKLANDQMYQAAGKKILNGIKTDAIYLRYDAALLLAFEGWPRVIKPGKKEGRVLELRTYQSPNEERGINKVAMFNRGEIPIFARSGMTGVFWGKAVAGTDLPQLTYMICHGSMEEAKKNWAAFGVDEEWKKMKAEQQYKDNVSKIANRFLLPVEGSEI